MSSAGFRSRSTARCWLAIGALLVLAFVLIYTYAAAVEPGNERFQRTWDRTDLAVRDGLVSRTWMWGPQANYGVMQEPYGEAPGGMREVQYFDKARMEDNSYRADGAPWDVTNGLLVVELISGQMQTGDASFESRQPAMVNVAGDFDDPSGPTYATFGAVLDAPPLPIGSPSAPFVIAQSITRDGTVTEDLNWANYGIGTAHLDDVTNHSIAQPFWAFMNSTGIVYENGQFVQAKLFVDPFFATGRPITEAYWSSVKVGGAYKDVLVQCFERRCLTYTPGNSEGFVVEAGNVGQHYYSWRYPDGGDGTPTAEPTSTATETAEPTATVEPSPTPALNYAYAYSSGAKFNPETRFNQPMGIAISPSGSVFISEYGANRIQLYESDGYLQIYVGAKGTGNSQFDGPQGMATDADGYLYVVDQNNHRVQKLDPTLGYVAQWGTRGSATGEFEGPQGIAISPAGMVYVADTGNDRIQIFSTSGEYVGQFGGFGTEDGKFNLPTSIAIDATGNVYVTDAFNHRVQKFDSSGAFLAKWGSKGAGESQFDTPQGIAVDSADNVYVADFKNNRIVKFTSGGEYLTQWGSLGDDDGEFNGPVDLAINAEDHIYVVELTGGQVQEFDSNGTFLNRWRDGIRGRLFQPIGLALDSSGNTYVTDAGYNHVQKFDASGLSVMYIGESAGAPGALVKPVAAETSPDGHLYVISSGAIVKFTQDGAYVTTWGRDGAGNGEFDEASGLALDADGNVYVADRNNNRIQKFTSDGLYITQWGALGNGNGEFNHPFDIAIHGERVYVVDQDNKRVQEFDRDGNYVRQWGSFGTGPGQFHRPFGIAVDQYGYVYVTDAPSTDMGTGDDRIQKFTPDGEYLTQFGSTGSGEGQFIAPYRVEVDAAGNIFVLDSGNYRVQTFIPVP